MDEKEAEENKVGAEVEEEEAAMEEDVKEKAEDENKRQKPLCPARPPAGADASCCVSISAQVFWMRQHLRGEESSDEAHAEPSPARGDD